MGLTDDTPQQHVTLMYPAAPAPEVSEAVAAAWDANFDAVQAAKAAAVAARAAYGAACQEITALSRTPGFRRRQIFGELTRDELGALADLDDARVAAYDAVQAADEAVKEAQRVFKAGVPEEDE